MSASSFIDVRRVFVDYTPRAGLLNRLSGRVSVSRSVLRDVSFQLGAGQHVLLFGAAAAGKSTLLRTLAGVLTPSRGRIVINGKTPRETVDLASGYVSSEESEPVKDTVGQILHAFALTHKLSAIPARIGAVAETLGIASLLERNAQTISTTQRLRVNLARAALSASPLVLLDDVIDQIGAPEVTNLLGQLFSGRTVIASTRSVDEAQRLELPVMLLHRGELLHFGTRDAIAASAGCPRVVHAWVEGMRYDVLRAIKQQAGVLEVRLLPSDQFDGQQLQVVLRSSRYLPSLYDVLSQVPLLRIQEEPVSLREIIAHLP